MPAKFIRFPVWRWWLIFWPPGLKRYIDDTAKFYAERIEIDQHGTSVTLTQWGEVAPHPLKPTRLK
jgi:hypothetical protein